MEWIRGRSLYEWARMHNPSCREVLRVLAQVARTLDVLHRGECLHRDIKGDNILVRPEGRAVLTDFGSGTWKGAPPLTEWVVPPNTREYRSPESLLFEWTHWRKDGALYETRSSDDIYALGVAAYHLVTGVYPPPGTDREGLKAQLQVPLPQRRPVQEFNKRVVPELSALIERMLMKEPEARAAAREVAEAAEAAAEQERPEADVPLVDLEWPKARVQAVPVQAVPGSGAQRSIPKERSVPVQVRAEHGTYDWSVRWLAVVVPLILIVLGLLQMVPSPRVVTPKVAQAEAPDAGMEQDAGTRGLGEEVLSARVDSREGPPVSEPFSKKVPEQPLPWQRQPPCLRSRAVIINGGCWKRLDIEPPCAGDEYEYQSSCYMPIMERARPPTTGKPR
jgi:hypothetical protein